MKLGTMIIICKWPLLKTFLRSEVKGQVKVIARPNALLRQRLHFHGVASRLFGFIRFFFCYCCVRRGVRAGAVVRIDTRKHINFWCKAYFDILNSQRVTHECERETDIQTLP